MVFDPDTNTQTILIHMTLLTIEGEKKGCIHDKYVLLNMGFDDCSAQVFITLGKLFEQ